MTEGRTAVFQTPSIYVVISGQWKTLVPVPNKHVLLRLVVFVLELSGLLFVLKLCLLLHTFRIQLERYYFNAVANS